MAKSPNKIKRIGILGGGQLARMMALSAHNLGIEPWVLSHSSMDPAAQVTRFWLKGDPNNLSDQKKIFQQTDVVTVESEFIDTNTLKAASEQTGINVFPQPQALAKLQDRLLQKLLFVKYKIPTSPFYPVSAAEDLQRAIIDLGFPLVLKKRRFGYDGYGTFILKDAGDAKKFLSSQAFKENTFIAEQFVPFKRELATSIARNKNGDMIQLPLVETRQKNSICLWVKGPLNAKIIQKNKFLQKIQNLIIQEKYIGVIAFEIFDTKQDLVVNETAPRVHNSAHYSMDALTISQFEYHVRAVCNQPLPAVEVLTKGFAMVNLLGSGVKKNRWVLSPNVNFHWYGKAENRRGRKLGHINVLANTPENALFLGLKNLGDFRI